MFVFRPNKPGRKTVKIPPFDQAWSERHGGCPPLGHRLRDVEGACALCLSNRQHITGRPKDENLPEMLSRTYAIGAALFGRRAPVRVVDLSWDEPGQDSGEVEPGWIKGSDPWDEKAEFWFRPRRSIWQDEISETELDHLAGLRIRRLYASLDCADIIAPRENGFDIIVRTSSLRQSLLQRFHLWREPEPE